METQLKTALANEQESIHNWLENHRSDDDYDVNFDMAWDEYRWTYDFMFHRSLRYSFIVLLFLVFESQLIGLCDDIKVRRKLPIRASDLKGDVISRTKTYLEKLVGVSSVGEQLWARVEDLSKVRNCIVHAMGKVELSSDQKHLRKLATKDYGLSISNDELPEQGLLIITPQYCQQAIKDVQELFKAIFDATGYGPAIGISSLV